MVPKDRKFTKDHEWVLIDGDMATIGLTDYAQHMLGDIVYVELPQPGDAIDAGGQLAVVESVKAASEVLSVPGGEVTEANVALEDAPETLNSDPWDTWIARIRVTDLNEAALLDHVAYEALVKAEEEKA
jgi:glycine cleavage system H protein